MDRLHGDTALAAAMAAVMLQELPGQLDGVRRAVATGDAEGLTQAAHLLKGSVGNFVAEESLAAAFRLEQLGRAGDLHAAPEALRALETALERLTPVLREMTA
jgi:HPt (histidine-containing phosphotransfer) domain-containing protein